MNNITYKKFNINGVLFNYDVNKYINTKDIKVNRSKGYMGLFFNNKGQFYNISIDPSHLSENKLNNAYIIYLRPTSESVFYQLMINNTELFPVGWNQITKLIPKDSIPHDVIKKYINILLEVTGEIKWIKPQSLLAYGANSVVTMSTIETEILHMGIAVSTNYISTYQHRPKSSSLGIIELVLNRLRDNFNCPFFVYTYGMFKCNSSKIFNSEFIGFVNKKDEVGYLSEKDRKIYEPKDYDEGNEIKLIIKNINNLPLLTNYCKSMSISKPYGHDIDSNKLKTFLDGTINRYDIQMNIRNTKLVKTPTEYFQHTIMELIAGDTVNKENPNLTSDQRISIYVQVLCALQLAQDIYKFEHLDLHGGNVMLIPTNKKYVDMKTPKYKYKIKLYGYMVKIIDMDFAKIRIKTIHGDMVTYYTLDVNEYGGKQCLKKEHNIDYDNFRSSHDMLYLLRWVFLQYDQTQYYIISNWIRDIHKSNTDMNYDIDSIYNELHRPILNVQVTPHELLENFNTKFIQINKIDQ